VPTLGLAFALVLAGYTIWDLDQVSGRLRGGLALASTGAPAPAVVLHGGPASIPAPSSGLLLSSGVTVACRIAMGATMTFMLFIMI
jgi:hypothetical protein